MDPATKNIKYSQDLLATTRLNLTEITGPAFNQWQGIHLDKHTSFLHTFELPKNLKFCLREYFKQIPPLPPKIDYISKQLNDLQAVIHKKNFDIVKAEAESIKLRAKAEEIHIVFNQAQKDTQVLGKASETIRENLNINFMLPAAKLSVGTDKAQQFAAGLQVFNLINDKPPVASEIPTINELLSSIDKYGSALRRIDTAQMPALTAEITWHFIQKGITASEAIKNFLDSQNRRIAKESAPLKETSRKISQLNESPLTEILTNGQKMVETIGRQILALATILPSTTCLKAVPALAKDLRTLYLVINSDLLPVLHQDIKSADSPLNPAVLARAMAQDYFRGISGFMVIIRFLIAKLMTGSRLVNNQEIQGLVVNTVNSCHFYYGSDKKDIDSLKNFLGQSLQDYSKPFPYDGLFLLLKSAVAKYGIIVENYIHNFNTDRPDDESQKVPGNAKFSKQQTNTLSILSDRIEQRVAELRASK